MLSAPNNWNAKNYFMLNKIFDEFSKILIFSVASALFRRTTLVTIHDGFKATPSFDGTDFFNLSHGLKQKFDFVTQFTNVNREKFFVIY